MKPHPSCIKATTALVPGTVPQVLPPETRGVAIQGCLVANAVMPGSVPEGSTLANIPHDLATMKLGPMTFSTKPTNPALAFSSTRTEKGEKPVVVPPYVSTLKPNYAPGMEPMTYPRAPVESSKGSGQRLRREFQDG